VAASRGLQLRVVASDAWVTSDRVLLRRVLQNYLANALRYTRRGGVIVTCPRGAARSLSIRVSDTGPGIAEHHREAIYAEFTRLERQSPWGEKGLGLGLSICDRIARLLGHELELRSRPGPRFHVRRARAARPTRRAARAGRRGRRPAPRGSRASSRSASTTTPTILQAMAALLERWGVRVVPAASIAEAQSAFANGGIDVVLADYHLDGGEDGLSLIESLRHGGVQPATAALLTADYGPELEARARALGCPVLRKPVKPAALRAFLGAAGAGRALAGAGRAGMIAGLRPVPTSRCPRPPATS
jgi:CheY-like chemotaxis protein